MGRVVEWTALELAILRQKYPKGGTVAVQKAMRDDGLRVRGMTAIHKKASKLKIVCELVRQPPIGMRGNREDKSSGWPVPTMDLIESLDCVRFRKWRGPVERGQLMGRVA